jgi:hypothetical protein
MIRELFFFFLLPAFAVAGHLRHVVEEKRNLLELFEMTCEYATLEAPSGRFVTGTPILDCTFRIPEQHWGWTYVEDCVALPVPGTDEGKPYGM